MKIETVIALIELGARTAGSMTAAFQALRAHSGKPVVDMTEDEMIAAVRGFKVKTPEELIAEGEREMEKELGEGRR